MLIDKRTQITVHDYNQSLKLKDLYCNHGLVLHVTPLWFVQWSNLRVCGSVYKIRDKRHFSKLCVVDCFLL